MLHIAAAITVYALSKGTAADESHLVGRKWLYGGNVRKRKPMSTRSVASLTYEQFQTSGRHETLTSLLPVLEGPVTNRKLSADNLAHCDTFNIRFSVILIRVSLQRYAKTFSARHSYINEPK